MGDWGPAMEAASLGPNTVRPSASRSSLPEVGGHRIGPPLTSQQSDIVAGLGLVTASAHAPAPASVSNSVGQSKLQNGSLRLEAATSFADPSLYPLPLQIHRHHLSRAPDLASLRSEAMVGTTASLAILMKVC